MRPITTGKDKKRELRSHWQRACKLILAKADVMTVSNPAQCRRSRPAGTAGGSFAEEHGCAEARAPVRKKAQARKPPASPDSPWVRGGRQRAIAAPWHAGPHTGA